MSPAAEIKDVFRENWLPCVALFRAAKSRAAVVGVYKANWTRDADGKWMHKKRHDFMHLSISPLSPTTMLYIGIAASLRRKRSPTRSFRWLTDCECVRTCVYTMRVRHRTMICIINFIHALSSAPCGYYKCARVHYFWLCGNGLSLCANAFANLRPHLLSLIGNWFLPTMSIQSGACDCFWPKICSR